MEEGLKLEKRVLRVVVAHARTFKLKNNKPAEKGDEEREEKKKARTGAA